MSLSLLPCVFPSRSLKIKAKHGISLFSANSHRSNDKDTCMISLRISLKDKKHLASSHPWMDTIPKVPSQFND